MRFAVTLGVMLAPVALASTQLPASAAEPTTFELIDPASFKPDQLLPPPPPRGSSAEAIELAEVRQIVTTASRQRLAQAQRDDAVEDPSIFDHAVGRRLADLPATWALLRTVQNDTDLTIGLAKKHFGRMRPWGVDPQLPHCDAERSAKPLGSYPSGHSGLGYSVGWVIAQLRPDLAPAVLARAQDYAQSRLVCGVHFPSDTEASHVVATLVAARLFGDPRLAARIAAARAELARQ